MATIPTDDCLSIAKSFLQNFHELWFRVTGWTSFFFSPLGEMLCSRKPKNQAGQICQEVFFVQAIPLATANGIEVSVWDAG